MSLAHKGFDSGDLHAAPVSARFWSKVCRLEMTKDTSNGLLGRIIDNLPPWTWRGCAFSQFCRFRIRWLPREFARRRAERLLGAFLHAEADLSSSADELLSNLMSCSPNDGLSAVRKRIPPMPAPLLPEHLMCLGVLCDTHHACGAIPAFIAACHDAIVASVRSPDDQLCGHALLTVMKAVECYGLFSTGDDMQALVPLLHQLIEHRPALASNAVSCLMQILDTCEISSPDYPLRQPFEDVQFLWSIVTGDVRDTSVVQSAFLIFEHFVADLPDDHLDILSDFLDRSMALFEQSPNFPVTGRVLWGCSLDFVTDIFRASRGSLNDQAMALIEHLMAAIHEPSAPIGDMLTVMLAAGEQLLHATAPFLGDLVDLVLTVIAAADFTTLEPAFELMSFLFHLHPFHLMNASCAISDLLSTHLDPELFPSASHPGSLRALASLLAAIPHPSPPAIHD
jgi:hypothetical protein